MRGPLNISIFDLVLLLDQYGNVLTRISIDLACQVHTCESDDEIPASYVRVCLDKVHDWGTNERVGRNRMQTRWSHNLQTARHASPGPCVCGCLSVWLKLSLAFGRVPLIPVTSTWTSSAVADRPYRSSQATCLSRADIYARQKASSDTAAICFNQRNPLLDLQLSQDPNLHKPYCVASDHIDILRD